MPTNVPIQTSSPVAQLVTCQPKIKPYRKAAIITGLIQIALSALSFAFGVASIFSGYFAVNIALPVWGALGFYLMAGCLGVIAGYLKEKNACVIVCCLVMSILAAVTALAHATIGSISAAHGSFVYTPEGYFVVSILSVLVAVIELATAIVTSVLMCCEIDGHNETCCCCLQPQPNIIGQPQYVPYVVQPGQVFSRGQIQVQRYQQQPFVGHPVVIGQPQVVGHPHMAGQPQVICQSQIVGQPNVAGQPQVIGRSQIVGQPNVTGQPQVIGQPQIVGQSQGIGQSQVVGQPNGAVQPQVMDQPHDVGQPPVVSQLQFTGQPQQNVEYMGQASGQMPVCTEQERN
ncbi:uncharacterized protein LOC117118214 [Anneissia japonica]|uniref:uncharacterized protein LOC117118214 n=1 Tax=Anneissia japonica TaxID=1529436 RepID=UPI001425673A|nr:uncharacterized protein LOC117118214 [Anneissia japonica]